MTFPNYWIWTIVSLLVSLYNFVGTDWKQSKIHPMIWIVLSFVPCGVHVISWVVNLLYLGENQYLIKDNKLNRWLGLSF